MKKFRNLEASLDRITAGPDVWIPPWLSAVGSREEIAEWKAILRTYHGPDRRYRELEFQREMRKRHPDMPLTVDELVEEGAKRLKANPWLRWCDGFRDDRWVNEVVSRLTNQEQLDLSAAIRALENLLKPATVETLPPTQRTVWEKACRLYRELARQEGETDWSP